jgi:hypothetical protein
MGLIAGELDITVPSVSFDAVDQFIKDSKILHDLSNFGKEEQIYFARNNRQYPWDRRVLETLGKPVYDYRNIDPFNSIIDIIDSLPIIKETRVILLLSQREQNNYDFNFHFDRDNQYGFRICFGLDTNKTFLEMAALKSEFKQYGENLNKIEDYMVEDTVHKLIPSRPNTVFCIKGNTYPHRVPITNSVQRFVVIVRGDLTSIDNLKFLTRIDE